MLSCFHLNKEIISVEPHLLCKIYFEADTFFFFFRSIGALYLKFNAIIFLAVLAAFSCNIGCIQQQRASLLDLTAWKFSTYLKNKRFSFQRKILTFSLPRPVFCHRAHQHGGHSQNWYDISTVQPAHSSLCWISIFALPSMTAI